MCMFSIEIPTCYFSLESIFVISCSTTTAICYNTSADYNVTTDDEIYIRAFLAIPEAQHYNTTIIVSYSNEQIFTSNVIKISKNVKL